MSQAFKCDCCKSFFTGNEFIQVKTTLPLVFGIKYSPENENAGFYYHDLCNDCMNEFVNDYKKTSEKMQQKREIERIQNVS